MPIFSYTAINPQGKAVRGTVEAPDAVSAKDALKDLHYEVQTISEPSRTNRAETETANVLPSVARPSFVYEGTDTAGVLHKGTVQAATRRDAFDQLQKNQKLSLVRLSPLGSPPMGRDPELEGWKAENATPKAERTLSFGQTANSTAESPTAKPAPNKKAYHPLFSTLRLYAGWLLAWYALFVALGYYARERTLPWDIPFVGAFASSGLVFSFVVAIFFFLLLSSLHRALHGKTMMGAGFAFLWIAIVIGVRIFE
jgi:hypothetical protein